MKKHLPFFIILLFPGEPAFINPFPLMKQFKDAPEAAKTGKPGD
jgi:hypothetical protein